MKDGMEIKPIDIDKHLKNYPQLYFGPEGASKDGIFNILDETAKIFGAQDTRKIHIGNLLCIASDLDWLIIDNEYGTNEDNVFDRIWPFPEAGTNSARIEAIARVYSSVLVSARKNKIVVHNGSISKDHLETISELLEKHKRVICFKYENIA